MRRSVGSFLRFLPMVALPCLLAGAASANHLHYVSITDTRFPENIPNPPWVLFDTYGESPLEEWIVYSGNDAFTTHSNNYQTFEASTGDGTAEVVFDSPTFADITNPSATAFYEFEIFTLDTSGFQSIEVGLTDLINQIKLDEASGVISASKAEVAGDDVGGIPPWSTTGNLPLRLQIYFNFATYVITYVVIDDTTGTETRASWQGSADPFENFSGDVEGTDPDNLDIYSFVLCEAQCGLTILGSDFLNCDTVDGAIDVDGCLRPPGVGNGQLDPGEACEDGNVLPGDGCDENGQLEKIGWKCQEAIATGGQKYAKDRLNHLQKCRNLLNKGVTLFQDKDKTLAIADRSECPTEFKTADKLAKSRAKFRKLLNRKCTDALVVALDTCGETVADLVSPDATSGCLIETHDAGVADLLTAQYGG